MYIICILKQYPKNICTNLRRRLILNTTYAIEVNEKIENRSKEAFTIFDSILKYSLKMLLKCRGSKRN